MQLHLLEKGNFEKKRNRRGNRRGNKKEGNIHLTDVELLEAQKVAHALGIFYVLGIFHSLSVFHTLTVFIAGAGVGGCFTALELAQIRTPEGFPKYQIIVA